MQYGNIYSRLVLLHGEVGSFIPRGRAQGGVGRGEWMVCESSVSVSEKESESLSSGVIIWVDLGRGVADTLVKE